MINHQDPEGQRRTRELLDQSNARHTDAHRSRERTWWIVGAVVVVGVLAATFETVSQQGSVTAQPPISSAEIDPLSSGDCSSADTDTKNALAARVTSDISVRYEDAVSISMGDTSYTAAPLGSSESEALVVAYTSDPWSDLVAVNGLARSHTDLPAGGSQDGIDAALDCL